MTNDPLQQLFSLEQGQRDFLHSDPRGYKTRGHIFTADTGTPPTVSDLKLKLNEKVTAVFRKCAALVYPQINAAISVVAAETPSGIEYQCTEINEFNYDTDTTSDKAPLIIPSHSYIDFAHDMRMLARISKNYEFLKKLPLKTGTMLLIGVDVGKNNRPLQQAAIGPLNEEETNALLQVWLTRAAFHDSIDVQTTDEAKRKKLLFTSRSPEYQAFVDAIQSFNDVSRHVSPENMIPQSLAEHTGHVIWTPRTDKGHVYEIIRLNSDEKPIAVVTQNTIDIEKHYFKRRTKNGKMPEITLTINASETGDIDFQKTGIDRSKPLLASIGLSADAPLGKSLNILIFKHQANNDVEKYSFRFCLGYTMDQEGMKYPLHINPGIVLGDLAEMLDSPEPVKRIKGGLTGLGPFTEKEANTMFRVLASYMKCHHHYTESSKGSADFYVAQEELETALEHFLTIQEDSEAKANINISPTSSWPPFRIANRANNNPTDRPQP